MIERIAYHITQDSEANRVMSFREDVTNKDSFFVTIKTIPSKHQDGIDDQREYLNIFKNKGGGQQQQQQQQQQNHGQNDMDIDHSEIQENLPNTEEIFSNQVLKFVNVGEERACSECKVNKVQAKVQRAPSFHHRFRMTSQEVEDRGYKTEENDYQTESDGMDGDQDTSDENSNANHNNQNSTTTNNHKKPRVIKLKRKRSRSSASNYESSAGYRPSSKEQQIYSCLEELCKKRYTRAAGLYEHYKLKHERQWDARKSEIREVCRNITLAAQNNQYDNSNNPDDPNAPNHQNSYITNVSLIKSQKSFPCPINDCPSGFARKSRMFKHVNQRHHTFWLNNEDILKEQNQNLNDHGAEKFVMPVSNPNLSKYERWLGGSMQIRLLNMPDKIDFLPDFHSYPGANGETGRWLCKICGKEYEYDLNSTERRDPTDMRMVLHHVRLHNQTNKVPCEFSDCDKTFVDQRNMKDHMRTHPGVEKLRCGICNFEDAKLNKYNSHMKQRHPEEFMQEMERKKREKEMMNQAQQG